ncbi:TlpA family protein disulfide reductase [Acidipropionibacterium timonense]|uniref:TlpA family protein disulfide reductase n=1 Tax=Acidipropionibacterium timonense TaxID=2161818 RepID=UPI001030545E|nr:TlpA disulfide reductase family protein [Acidipropionibacterium timonense]
MRSRLAAAATAVALLVAGCSSAPSATSDKGFAGGDGSYTKVAVADRQQAPTLSGTGLDGKSLTTAGAAGKVVVVNVWGSWCAPCRHEAPELVTAAKATAGTAAFYGIDTRDLDRGPAQAFTRTFKVTWPSFYDPDGALLLSLSALPPKAIPSTIVIDRKGRVAARFLGEVTASTLTAAVKDIAGEGS